MRIRDFIRTTEGMVFAVASYVHPQGRTIAFLRYYPHPEGDRTLGDAKYKKVASVEESFQILEESYPDHIYQSDVTGSTLQGVQEGRVAEVYRPWEGLERIYRDPKTPLDKKITVLSDSFPDIPLDKKGITGSCLLGTARDTSDMDFVIYGTDNHRLALEAVKESFETGGALRPLGEEEWRQAYEKRFPQGSALSLDEFMWHEGRKYHKGTLEGTVFDILLVRDASEIRGAFGDQRYRRQAKRTLRCTAIDDTLAFDSPSVYKVDCPSDPEIKEVVSYTHTYAGQAFSGEEIEVSGYLEEVTGKEDYTRVVVGTTRESPEEFIKVAKP